MLKMVCFDLDGVLVDACEWHRLALNEALQETCDYEITLDDHKKIYNGLPTKKKLSMLSKKNIIPKEHHEKVFTLKQSKTVDIINKLAHNDQTKIDLLKRLSDDGIVVCCVTNSISLTANLMLEKAGIKNLFDLIITNEDVKNPKPDPEGYNKALSHFNFAPKDVIVVEDSDKGVAAAKASGCAVFRVENAKQVNIENLRSFINESFNTNGGRR